MQVADGAQRRASTMPHRRRLDVLLAALVIALLGALLVWTTPLATSGAGAEDVNLSGGAGSAVIHDDPWNLPQEETGSAPIHDDPWNP